MLQSVSLNPTLQNRIQMFLYPEFYYPSMSPADRKHEGRHIGEPQPGYREGELRKRS